MDDSSLTPYHGPHEGYSKLFLVMSLCFSGAALALLGLRTFFDVRSIYDGNRALNTVVTVSIAVAVISAAVSSVSLFKWLSTQIAKGDENAEFLDRARFKTSMMAQAFSIAIMILAGQLAVR